MGTFTQDDRTGLVFFSFALVIAGWAVFDTGRFLRLLTFNRQTTFTGFQLMAVRVPGTICILGALLMILMQSCWGIESRLGMIDESITEVKNGAVQE